MFFFQQLIQIVTKMCEWQAYFIYHPTNPRGSVHADVFTTANCSIYPFSPSPTFITAAHIDSNLNSHLVKTPLYIRRL